MTGFILTVDDEPDICDLVKDSLTRGSHEVTSVLNGKDALCLIEEEKPDLVLLDLKLKELDGWEVLRRMYGKSHIDDVPVAMLTGQELTITKILRKDMENMVAYIEKPIKPTGLLQTVNDILERVETIRTLKGEIREKSPQGEALASAFGAWSRTQMIHEFLLKKLEKLKSECYNTRKRERLEDLMEGEGQIIEQSKIKRRGILEVAGVEIPAGSNLENYCSQETKSTRRTI